MPAKKRLSRQTESIQQPVMETPEHVRTFASAVRAHVNGPRGKHLEPAHGVIVLSGYNGLSRLYPGGGYRYIHIATREDLCAMSDQQIYDIVIAAGQRRVV